MDNLEKQLKNLKHTALSREERERTRGMLSEYAKMHPVRSGEFVRPHEGGYTPVQLLSNLKNLLHKPMPAFLVAAIIALTAGGSVSYAAEGAVPGDALYPVKVSINEQVRSAVAISNESEASLQARLAERRLEEAEELAARGSLEAETRADLETRLSTHIEKYEELAASVEDEGDMESSTELAARFEAALEAHENVLAGLSAEERIEKNVRTEVNAIAARVRSQLAESVAARTALGLGVDVSGAAEISLMQASSAVSEDAETDSETTVESATSASAKATFGTEVSARERLRIAERLLDEAKNQYERRNDDMSVEARTRLEAKIAEAESVLAESEAAFDAGNYGESLAQSRAVMRLATEIRVEANLTATLHLRFEQDDKNDTDDNARNGNDELEGLTEAEATVYTNETLVEVEINDETEVFMTDRKTRVDIVADIAARFDVTEAEVDAVLELEIEDRASRTEGSDGRDGEDGEDGEDGRNGEDGADGEDGQDGGVRIDANGRVDVRF